ncbi:MAG: hypothetical protein EBU84_14970 [Actinobacteria bacterium]|nr:hypothetical protein [Actinomycetota bacterium]
MWPVALVVFVFTALSVALGAVTAVNHKIDSVNVQVYANKLSIEELAEIANPIQNKIFQLVKINLPVA